MGARIVEFIVESWLLCRSLLIKPPPPPVSVLLFLTRALRKALTHLEMRRAARRPNLPLKVKPALLGVRPPVSLPAPAHPVSTNEPIVLED